MNGTLHGLVKVSDFNQDGRSDLLFQTQNGITVLGKNSTAWDFNIIANHNYGLWIGQWNFNGGDLLAPFAGDFEGNGSGQKDFVITSAWGLDVLTVNGTGLKLIHLTPYASLPITDPERLIGVGKFDHSGRRRLLFKNIPDPGQPTKPAVLTYHNDNSRTGLNPKETELTPEAIRQRGLRKKYTSDLGGVIEGAQEQVYAQVL